MLEQEIHNTKCEWCGEAVVGHLKCKRCLCPAHAPNKLYECPTCHRQHNILNEEGLCEFCAGLDQEKKGVCVACGKPFNNYDYHFLCGGNYCRDCGKKAELISEWRLMNKRKVKQPKHLKSMARLAKSIWQRYGVKVEEMEISYRKFILSLGLNN